MLTFVWFELRRLGRKWVFWMALTAAVAAGLVEAIEGRTVSSIPFLFLPCFSVFLAACYLVWDFRNGGLELFLNSGLTLEKLMWLRFALAAVVVGTAQILVFFPSLVDHQLTPVEVFFSLLRTVFFAAVGASFGFFASAGSLVIIPFLTTALLFWWVGGLSMDLLGQPVTVGAARVIGLLVQSFCPFPLVQSPLKNLAPRSLDFLPLLWTFGVLFSRHVSLKRRCLFGSREG
ncbi:MAG: hypothetical protein ACOY7U_10555 [Acidobacteriota bacterium]